MKKNGILTFLFAFVPGAGQMYQGYMKRGLSLITLFFLRWRGFADYHFRLAAAYLRQL